jgi:hypothetical protein
MNPRYSLRYVFEWGGPCLWASNDAARDRFGYGVNVDDLPLSNGTTDLVAKLIAWHGQALNHDYPPDPSPWRQDECDRFNIASKQLLQTIRAELGNEYDIADEQPLMSEDPNLDKYLKDPQRYRKF